LPQFPPRKRRGIQSHLANTAQPEIDNADTTIAWTGTGNPILISTQTKADQFARLYLFDFAGGKPPKLFPGIPAPGTASVRLVVRRKETRVLRCPSRQVRATAEGRRARPLWAMIRAADKRSGVDGAVMDVKGGTAPVAFFLAQMSKKQNQSRSTDNRGADGMTIALAQRRV